MGKRPLPSSTTAHLTGAGTAPTGRQAAATSDPNPTDGYQAPDWLRHARTVYFDSYSPPVYPHIKDFDAKRLVESTLATGADTLWWGSIGYWAHYPSKAYPPHPELGNRDLTAEVAQECRRAGLHLYDYAGYGVFFMEVGWVDQHPEFADWVQRDPDQRRSGAVGVGPGRIQGCLHWTDAAGVCARQQRGGADAGACGAPGEVDATGSRRPRPSVHAVRGVRGGNDSHTAHRGADPLRARVVFENQQKPSSETERQSRSGLEHNAANVHRPNRHHSLTVANLQLLRPSHLSHNRGARVAVLRGMFAFGPERRSRSLWNHRSPSPESSQASRCTVGSPTGPPRR